MTTATKSALSIKDAHLSQGHDYARDTVHTRYLHVTLISVLVLFTAVCWLTPLDLVMSRWFLGATGWVGPSYRLLSWFYFPLNAVFFLVPLLMGGLIVLVSLAPTAGLKRARPYRVIGLFITSTTLLGAGFFNSFLLKIIFARPRPHSVFAGEASYYRPLEIAVAHWGALDMSFPSGHVSMASVSVVFFFAFRFAQRRFQKMMKWGLGVVLPLFAAPIMTVSRVAYGDHFVSDGVFAIACTYGVTLFLYYQFDVPGVYRRMHEADEAGVRVRIGVQDVLYIVVSLAVVFALIMLLIMRFDGLRRLV
ncbi:MAG: phosphatase PAP2 family protein [Acholeplasmatales bacterium]|nr:MAG: phosphatase PAP2 family protein [Acholeplasmatales bacterium]